MLTCMKCDADTKTMRLERDGLHCDSCGQRYAIVPIHNRAPAAAVVVSGSPGAQVQITGVVSGRDVVSISTDGKRP